MEPNFRKLTMQNNVEHPRHRKKGRKRFWWLAAAILLAILAFFIWGVFQTTGNAVFNYAFSNGPTYKSTDDRINVLLLGLAGGKHDGTLLTDSIIIASYSLKSHKVTLISLPRDLWVDGIKEKVNAAYELGVQRPEGGLTYASDKIDDLLGIPIHYAIRIDFAGFSRAIDLLGGVDVNVPKTFDDYNYPIAGKEDDLCGLQQQDMDLTQDQAYQYGLAPGPQKVLLAPDGKIATDDADFSCRFEHIHFNAGKNHMDGTTALKFVRSRHGNNGEGSDFARSRRQQLVIQAFREKALSASTIFNPGKISGLIGTLGDSIETNIPKDNYLDFYNLAKNLTGVDSIVLGDLGNGKSVLQVGDVGIYHAFVLVPPNDDFTQVQAYIKQKLAEDAVIATPSAKLK